MRISWLVSFINKPLVWKSLKLCERFLKKRLQRWPQRRFPSNRKYWSWLIAPNSFRQRWDRVSITAKSVTTLIRSFKYLQNATLSSIFRLNQTFRNDTKVESLHYMEVLTSNPWINKYIIMCNISLCDLTIYSPTILHTGSWSPRFLLVNSTVLWAHSHKYKRRTAHGTINKNTDTEKER